MQGAGSACVGVWEFGLPVGRGEGARRAIRFWGLKELLFTAVGMHLMRGRIAASLGTPCNLAYARSN